MEGTSDERARRRPQELLIDYYRRFGNPEFGAEEAALEAFERKLGRPGWAPENPYAGGYDGPVEVGLLALHLRDADADRLLVACAAQVADRGYADRVQLAELHAAAMLRAMGLKARLLAPRGNQPTPDIVVETHEGIIDVEVVTGQRKAGERALHEAMGRLANTIPFRADGDTIVFLNGELGPETYSEIVTAAAALQPGEHMDRPGAWRVVVIQTSGPSDTAQAAAARESLQPADWSGPKLFTNRLVTTERGPQRVEVGSRLLAEDYLNPVKRKAERPQRTGTDRSYVIAFNVAALVNAITLLPGLKLALSTWDHVAGVLMFYEFFPMGQKEWRLLLVRNPAASNPLPGWFLGRIGETFSKHQVHLYEAGETTTSTDS